MSTAAHDLKAPQSTHESPSVDLKALTPTFAHGYPEINGNGSKYDNQQRIEAAIMYAHKGTFSKAGRAINIPERTLYDWSKEDWWDHVVAEVRSQNNDLYVAKYAKIIEKATKITLKKLPDASARDAMIIAATANDKLRLALNQPTSIRADSDTVKSLAAEFKRLSQDHKNIQESVVSTQEPEDNNQ